MPEESNQSRICEVCQKAVATVHVCEVTVETDSGGDEQTRTHEYCVECAQKQELVLDIEIPTAIGPCYYCGGQARGGGLNTGPALTIRKQKWHWTCQRCARIEHEYFLAELPKLYQGLSDQEAARQLEELIRRTDNYVRQTLERESNP